MLRLATATLFRRVTPPNRRPVDLAAATRSGVSSSRSSSNNSSSGGDEKNNNDTKQNDKMAAEAGGVVKTPRDVLSFWYSEEAYFGDKPELMASPEFLAMKSKTQWYAGTKVRSSRTRQTPTHKNATHISAFTSICQHREQHFSGFMTR